MTSFNKRVYEMLVRVLIFAKTYPQFFAKGSPTGLLIEQIDSAVQQLSGHKASQTAGTGDGKTSTGDRALARSTLRNQLEAISRTAKGLKFAQFWVSRDKSDQSLLEMGHRFAWRAEPVKQQFVDSHMPPDFIDRLNTAAQTLEKIMNDQVFTENARRAATTAIEHSRSAALEALERLSPMMENLLRDDPPAFTVWQSARRVERYSRRRRAESDASAKEPPVTNAAPASAQT